MALPSCEHLFIDNAWSPASDTFASTNPADGKELAQVTQATSADIDRAVRLEETEPDAKGLWRVNVYVGDALRETLSEGQLLTVDLALSAGYRKHVGLDWYACDDGFGALGGDEAERLAPALGDGWVITHKPEVVVSLGEAGWRSVTVDEGKVTP